MAFQSGRMITVAFEAESTYGQEVTPSAPVQLRVARGAVNPTRTPIVPNTNRADGMSSRPRSGTIGVGGQYLMDLQAGGVCNPIFEAIMRSSFDSGETIDESDSLGDLSVSSGVATFATGGLTSLAKAAVGDIIKCTAGMDSSDLNKNIRIVAMTNNSMSLARLDGTPITDVAGPVATYTFTRDPKILNGTTDRSYNIEEREMDIDASELFLGARWTSLNMSLQPNGTALLTLGVLAQNVITDKTGVDSPFFASPTLLVAQELTSVEAKLRLGTTDLTDVTSLDITLDLNATVQPVVGSNLTPDVFIGQPTLTGRIGGLRQDLSRLANVMNEDSLDLHMFFSENEAEPADYVSFFMGGVTLGTSTKSEIGQDGPRTATFDIQAGADDRGGLYDNTMLKIQTNS